MGFWLDFLRLAIYFFTAAISLAISIVEKKKTNKVIWLSVSVLWTITFLFNLATIMGLL